MGRFSLWWVVLSLRKPSVTMVGLYKKSCWIKHHGESLYCILLSFTGALLLSSAVCQCRSFTHTGTASQCFQTHLINSEIYITLYGKAHGHSKWQAYGAFKFTLRDDIVLIFLNLFFLFSFVEIHSFASVITFLFFHNSILNNNAKNRNKNPFISTQADFKNYPKKKFLSNWNQQTQPFSCLTDPQVPLWQFSNFTAAFFLNNWNTKAMPNMYTFCL